MKTHISVWGAVAVAICIQSQAFAQQTDQPQAQPQVQVKVVVSPEEIQMPQPLSDPYYTEDALSIQARMVLREYRAQKRRAYYENLIAHQAKMDEMYHEKVAALKQSNARAVATANGRKSSPITNVADSKP